MKVGLRAVSCTLLLMLAIIYVFAVAFRQLTDDSELGAEHFPTVPKTIRYLLLQGCTPDLTEVVLDIWGHNDLYAIVFIIFIFIVSITIMNMLVGVLCGVINTITSVEKEQVMIEFVRENLLKLMDSVCELDEDNDGKISRDEFDALMRIPATLRTLDQMGVDVVGLVDLADFIFKDENTCLSWSYFIELVLQLRGSNQATVKDIVDLRKCVVLEMVQLRMDLTASGAIGDVCEFYSGSAESAMLTKAKSSAGSRQNLEDQANKNNKQATIVEEEEGESEEQSGESSDVVKKKKKVVKKAVPKKVNVEDFDLEKA